jgi:hypothetical protein
MTTMLSICLTPRTQPPAPTLDENRGNARALANADGKGATQHLLGGSRQQRWQDDEAQDGCARGPQSTPSAISHRMARSLAAESALSLSPDTQCRLPTQVAALNTVGNPRATIQTGDTWSRLNPVPREVLHARRLSHRFSRRLIPAGIRIACETLADF